MGSSLFALNRKAEDYRRLVQGGLIKRDKVLVLMFLSVLSWTCMHYVGACCRGRLDSIESWDKETCESWYRWNIDSMAVFAWCLVNPVDRIILYSCSYYCFRQSLIIRGRVERPMQTMKRGD